MNVPRETTADRNIDPALVLNDPLLIADPFRILSLRGPKVIADVQTVVEIAQQHYPGVSAEEVDAAIHAAGGERLRHINLDIWPAVKRWLGSVPRTGRPEVYHVPIGPLLHPGPKRPPSGTDVVAAVPAGVAIAALTTALGGSSALTLGAGVIGGVVVLYRRWRRHVLAASRHATYERQRKALEAGPAPQPR